MRILLDLLQSSMIPTINFYGKAQGLEFPERYDKNDLGHWDNTGGDYVDGNEIYGVMSYVLV